MARRFAPHRHFPEVDRKLEVALAENFRTPLVEKTEFMRQTAVKAAIRF
jgi:hypothetical protein